MKSTLALDTRMPPNKRISCGGCAAQLMRDR
jgi:hypothetical protein